MAFRDECIDVDIDASQIFWVLTANSAEDIPNPLLDRMAVYVDLGGFDPRLGM